MVDAAERALLPFVFLFGRAGRCPSAPMSGLPERWPCPGPFRALRNTIYGENGCDVAKKFHAESHENARAAQVRTLASAGELKVELPKRRTSTTSKYTGTTLKKSKSRTLPLTQSTWTTVGLWFWTRWSGKERAGLHVDFPSFLPWRYLWFLRYEHWRWQHVGVSERRWRRHHEDLPATAYVRGQGFGTRYG